MTIIFATFAVGLLVWCMGAVAWRVLQCTVELLPGGSLRYAYYRCLLPDLGRWAPGEWDERIQVARKDGQLAARFQLWTGLVLSSIALLGFLTLLNGSLVPALCCVVAMPLFRWVMLVRNVYVPRAYMTPHRCICGGGWFPIGAYCTSCGHVMRSKSSIAWGEYGYREEYIG